MAGMLYFAALICLGLFMFVGKGILEINTILDSTKVFYNYVGYMSFGLGVFSSSVLLYLGRRVGVE